MIIMKFGGTSVGSKDAIVLLGRAVKARLTQNPFIVVSALSGVTNLLLFLVSQIEKGDRITAEEVLEKIKKRHSDLTNELFGEKEHSSLIPIFEDLKNFSEGLLYISEVSPRSSDKLLSFGEKLSSIIVTEYLSSIGINAKKISSQKLLITDDNFGKAAPNIELTKKTVLDTKINEDQKTIYVTEGFVGATKSGLTTTLGRGGSDFSASILGVALGAKEIQIWTDVDGMLTTDPRICLKACLIEELSFEEASELAYFGAKVLHPSTIFPAIDDNIPVFIFNTMNQSGNGTKISNSSRIDKSLIKAIAVKKDITVITVNSSRMLLAHGFLKSIFEVFDFFKTSVDLVSTSEVNVSLTIDNDQYLTQIIAKLKEFSQVTVEKSKTIICIVGAAMRSNNGIAGRVFYAIRDSNVNLISQGASEINLSFIVDNQDATRVVNLLHDEFFR